MQRRSRWPALLWVYPSSSSALGWQWPAPASMQTTGGQGHQWWKREAWLQAILPKSPKWAQCGCLWGQEATYPATDHPTAIYYRTWLAHSEHDGTESGQRIFCTIFPKHADFWWECPQIYSKISLHKEWKVCQTVGLFRSWEPLLSGLMAFYLRTLVLQIPFTGRPAIAQHCGQIEMGNSCYKRTRWKSWIPVLLFGFSCWEEARDTCFQVSVATGQMTAMSPCSFHWSADGRQSILFQSRKLLHEASAS